MKPADGSKTFPGQTQADEQQQAMSEALSRRLVDLFGDADQTSIKLQGSRFHADIGKFSGVTNEEAREKLRAAGLLQD